MRTIAKGCIIACAQYEIQSKMLGMSDGDVLIYDWKTVGTLEKLAKCSRIDALGPERDMGIGFGRVTWHSECGQEGR